MKYIIIGQGIAGSLLAYQLLERGQNVQVFDTFAQPSSSQVAAGMYNPVTGKRLVKTWLADDIFPYLHQFYTQLEEKLATRFFYPQGIYRPFKNIEEQNYFTAKTANVGLEDYLSTEVNHTQYAQTIHNQLGGLAIKQAGWVDVPVMLGALRRYIAPQPPKGEFVDKESLLEVANATSSPFGGWGALADATNSPFGGRGAIFCEGVYVKQNPYFNWLPLDSVKGETLTIEIPDATLSQIINQGIFLMPLGNNLFRVGSTYNRNNMDWEVTEEGRNELIEKLDKVLKSHYKIIEQNAGLRPTTPDRRPFLGLHPEFENIGIFNGLGTKGVSLAPYLSNLMADFLVNKKDLMPDVNINRFHALYLERK